MNKMGAMNAEEMKNYKGVFVFAQQVDNKLSGISFELIGEGKRLAEKLDEQVTAVLIGSDVKGLVDELAEYGADRVIVVVPLLLSPQIHSTYCFLPPASTQQNQSYSWQLQPPF